jgi:hypothetical protein
MNKGVTDPEISVGVVGMYTYHLPPRAPGRGKGEHIENRITSAKMAKPVHDNL